MVSDKDTLRTELTSPTEHADAPTNELSQPEGCANAVASDADTREAHIFQCSTCMKGYTYRRAYEKHLKVSGHGEPYESQIAALIGSTVPTQDTAEELKLIADLLDPFNDRALLMADLPMEEDDDGFVVKPHMSDDIFTQIAVANSLPPSGLSAIDNKAPDILFYQYMLRSRALANIQCQTVFDGVFANDQLKPGQCVICKKHIPDPIVFYSHAVECNKLTTYRCDYCHTLCNNRMARHRHMKTCEFRLLCEGYSTKDAAADLLRQRDAERFGLALMAKFISSSDKRTASVFAGYSIDAFREWTKRKKSAQAGKEALPT